MAEALRDDERPALLLWPIRIRRCRSRSVNGLRASSTSPPLRKIENAGHCLQEDAGAEIGAIIAEWLVARLPRFPAWFSGGGRPRPDPRGCFGEEGDAPRRPLVLDPGDGPGPVGAGRGPGWWKAEAKIQLPVLWRRPPPRSGPLRCRSSSGPPR